MDFWANFLSVTCLVCQRTSYRWKDMSSLGLSFKSFIIKCHELNTQLIFHFFHLKEKFYKFLFYLSERQERKERSCIYWFTSQMPTGSWLIMYKAGTKSRPLTWVARIQLFQQLPATLHVALHQLKWNRL